MDSFRAFDEDADSVLAAEDEAAIEAPPEIGVDERRMHVRAYNFWVSLLKGRTYPPIGALDPSNIGDFGPHGVLLDFTSGSDNPGIAFIGDALRQECDLPEDIGHVDQVPPRSLLSRLTDHYLQIIANCAPIGFEAEFVSERGIATMYRGILMPFSSDGETIDYIYGVLNWKEVAGGDIAASLAREVDRVAATPPAEASPIWADGPNASPAADQDDPDQPTLDLGFDAALADRLAAARDGAEAARNARARSHAALYRALGQAYDFARAAERAPDDYAELLDDAGIKVQARAPMTAIAKLVFGADHDKARLTEYAAALAHGVRREVAASGFAEWLEGFDGGLKGVVRAERALRRPARTPDRFDAARAELRAMRPIATVAVDAGPDEFVLLLARRQATGGVAVLAPVPSDAGLIERAIRKSAA